jgi:hypothetical protein
LRQQPSETFFKQLIAFQTHLNAMDQAIADRTAAQLKPAMSPRAFAQPFLHPIANPRITPDIRINITLLSWRK